MPELPSPPPASAAPQRSAANEDPPAWPVWIAPAGIVFGYFTGALLEVIALAAGGNASNPGSIATLVGNILFDLGAVGAAVWLVARLGPTSPADFGYRRVSLSTGVGAFAAAAVLYYAATAVYGTIFRLPNEKLPVELSSGHGTALALTAAFVCVVAPVLEELFFRGFVFGALRNIPARFGGVWTAAVLTGVLFGIAHASSASPEYLVPLAFLGFMLCLVRWRTHSLYPCMALHSANNALALGVAQSWTAAEIVALLLGSWLVMGVLAGPLGARTPALA